MSDLHRQRVAITMCAKCRKNFEPAERVIMVAIVQKTGRNPETKEMGTMLGSDFELVHASCVDTKLEAKIIIPS